MIVFHGTNHFFEEFDASFFGRGENASNGALGVHVGATTKIPRAFGTQILVLEVETPVVEVFSILELKRLHDLARRDQDGGFELYCSYRNMKLSEGINVLAFRLFGFPRGIAQP